MSAAAIISYIIVFLVIVAVIVAIIKKSPNHPWIFEGSQRRAGRIGEERATNAICSVLRENDRLFTNVEIAYDDKPAELDNVIVNQYGVFIIEVKNYKGRLTGSEDDYMWWKCHTSEAGNVYYKEVRNPIKQVKRQVYILANYLRQNISSKVWVEGYALLLDNNSPVESQYVLSSIEEINKAIHFSKRNRLNQKNINEIVSLLSEE